MYSNMPVLGREFMKRVLLVFIYVMNMEEKLLRENHSNNFLL